MSTVQETLEVKMEYQYGDIKINPFEDKRNTQEDLGILIRDVEKERHVMSIIERSAMQYNGSSI